MTTPSVPSEPTSSPTQVVAGDVLAQRAAGADDVARGHDGLEPGDPVAHDAEPEGVGTAGVRRDHPAHLRLLGRARVGPEAQAVLAREAVQVRRRQARLDLDAPQPGVEPPHRAQPGELDDHLAAGGDRPARQPGRPAARDEREPGRAAVAHDRGDLRCRSRADHGRGAPGDEPARLRRVGQRPGVRAVDDVLGADDPRQVGGDGRGARGVSRVAQLRGGLLGRRRR